MTKKRNGQKTNKQTMYAYDPFSFKSSVYFYKLHIGSSLENDKFSSVTFSNIFKILHAVLKSHSPLHCPFDAYHIQPTAQQNRLKNKQLTILFILYNFKIRTCQNSWIGLISNLGYICLNNQAAFDPSFQHSALKNTFKEFKINLI